MDNNYIMRCLGDGKNQAREILVERVERKHCPLTGGARDDVEEGRKYGSKSFIIESDKNIPAALKRAVEWANKDGIGFQNENYAEPADGYCLIWKVGEFFLNDNILTNLPPIILKEMIKNIGEFSISDKDDYGDYITNNNSGMLNSMNDQDLKNDKEERNNGGRGE